MNQHHNLNESIEQLNEILKIHPNHDKSLDLLGIIYIKQNKADKALKVINKSIEINKDIKKYLDMKYKLLIYKGDNNNALDCLQLLHKNPNQQSVRLDWMEKIQSLLLEKGLNVE